MVYVKLFFYEPEKMENRNMGGTYIVDKGDFLVLFHSLEQNVFEMNKSTGKIKKRKFVKNECECGKYLYTNKTGYSMITELSDEWICIFNNNSWEHILWSRTTDEQRVYSCRMPEKELYEFEKQKIEKEIMLKTPYYHIYESNLDMNIFLDYISNHDTFFEEEIQQYKKNFECFGESGKQINEYVKKVL